MHDPMTVAWEFRLPFFWRESYRRPSILTIWHNDPETDGTDDSCCAWKRLGKKHKGLLKCMAGDEARTPWFRRERAKEPSSPADAESLLRGALWHAACAMKLDRWSLHHKRVTFAQCDQLACELIHNGVDNVRTSLCLLPGWHTNDRNPDGPPVEELDIEDDAGHERESRRPPDDVRYPKEASEYWRKEVSEQFFRMIARILSRETARWWQHPRWHFWHWSFQVHAWQRFKRRFIERCSKCGVRYKGRGDVFSGWGGGATWCGDCQSRGFDVVRPTPAEVEQAQDPRA